MNFFSSLINFTINIDDSSLEQRLRLAPTIHEMCAPFNITIEDHMVRTEDDYILTLHRIPPSAKRYNGKVVYLHHGLLMCSDIWCCQLERNKNLPFVLHDLGFDVWMGNNRGNKYSTAHLHKLPKSRKFWDFSIDEFAFFDIPNSIDFILKITHVEKLICVGFSQGSAQMFASFAINEYLNSKVAQFIAIAPAMTPRGLHNRIVDTFAKSSPTLMYLFFGRNILLPSAIVWLRTLHPAIFNFCIDFGNRILFNWRSLNISPQQKLISYSKLYSTTSVKSVVHWFQILRSQKFQMFEEQDNMFNSLTRPYQIARFPTRTNIKIPILLIYGGNDSLVDIKVMKKNLPETGVFDIKVENHEHLDLIWGEKTDTLVIAKVLKFIEFFEGVSRRNSIVIQNSLKTIENHTNNNNSILLEQVITPNKMGPTFRSPSQSLSIPPAIDSQHSPAATTSTMINRYNTYPKSNSRISQENIISSSSPRGSRPISPSSSSAVSSSLSSESELNTTNDGQLRSGIVVNSNNNTLTSLENDMKDDYDTEFEEKVRERNENKLQKRQLSRYLTNE